ncbi:uncharacterized protein UV8b_06512 [Ustilaginoidea virens]|uniref:RING-type E3 ubiquitin transferase n=1 Tax=Ustilaginoidea virens TaxID=1159556 RepID=A0A8E5HVG4_USTVR|nr:uncharacterized protein UV8b_06512 [Ustilaginoidea virens]QUC22271.1 hypothetical protein UV8b_06512 [Ustilaginoidea virens]
MSRATPSLFPCTITSPTLSVAVASAPSTPKFDVMLARSPRRRSPERASVRRSILPPLPPDRSAVQPSSSPRPHASTSSASAPPVAKKTRRSRNPPSQTNPPSTPGRRRMQSPPCWQSLRQGTRTILSPVQWGEDTITDITDITDRESFTNGTSSARLSGEDEQFLLSFEDQDFSSPSSYPSFSTSLPAGKPPELHQAANDFLQASVSSPSSVASPPCRSKRPLAASSRSTTQLTSSTVDESRSLLFFDETDGPFSQRPPTTSSFSDTIQQPSRMQHFLRDISAANKRQITPQSNIAVNYASVEPLALPTIRDGESFGDSVTTHGSSDLVGGEDLAAIDLTEANEVPGHLRKPEVVDNMTKISQFQCVICMDDATTLTVTHCGHLYCAQCLHSSLHVEATKGKCPMCRAKIDMKPRQAYNSKTKGFWQLELKLMTATRKGKRKADDLS